MQISLWMSRGRALDKCLIPHGDALPGFKAAWRVWYMQLQPQWRGATWPLRRSPADPGAEPSWEGVQLGGPCGFYLAVLGVAWWLSAQDGKLDGDMLEAIAELQWVLQAIPAPSE